ncbi:sodium/potassium-transporting ATPase subunit gamma isoform X3 [Monodon monoceros]|uniref:sodium/potassium-transporting ATPase subunit gamma isoform X3 n=1 Tax=Monodon monoceros TaxID=40151 RepID=UPI0010F92809|nr:sodium/potassium-transporting ATPase subunit gamma isoform X3 [Monodon monoceros]
MVGSWLQLGGRPCIPAFPLEVLSSVLPALWHQPAPLRGLAKLLVSPAGPLGGSDIIASGTLKPDCWVQSLVPPLRSCLTSGKSLNLPALSLPGLPSGDHGAALATFRVIVESMTSSVSLSVEWSKRAFGRTMRART